MKKFKRIFLIVMDSFGAGHAKTGLLTAMTVQIPWVILLRSSNWKIPNLTKLGLADFTSFKGK